MPALHDLTMLEQAAAVRAEEVSPVELTEHYLRRIDELDATLGAYVTVTADRALADAAADEAALLERPSDLPALHGVPVPVKDLAATRGVRTTYGSAAYARFVPDWDDTVVALLRAAGTVLLGKTSTPEFGAPCYTEPAVAPPARTPWDLTRSAGGSSGGAAAAVAAGLASAAHGSDGGGSCRIPASVCGVVGLKPSRGRVSLGPVKADVSGLPTDGVLARTVADCAALLDAIAQPVPGDPYPAAPLPPGETFLAAAGRDPGRLRVARYLDPVIDDAPVHSECAQAYEHASWLLERLGHDVEDVPRPFDPAMVPVFEVVWAVLTTLTPVAPSDEQLLRPLTRWLRGRGAATSAPQFALAMVAMQQAARRAVAALAPYDAVLTPTLAQPPVPVGALRDDADPARDFAAQERFSPYAAVWNVTGMPAISLPLWWSSDGLPIGVMLAARRGEEARMLALAAQLEAAEPWRDRHPPRW